MNQKYFPRAKTLLTPEKTGVFKVDQFHQPFLNKLAKVVVITAILMLSSSIIIPALFYFYSQPHQVATTSSENAGN